jgi:hypothetical protein
VFVSVRVCLYVWSVCRVCRVVCVWGVCLREEECVGVCVSGGVVWGGGMRGGGWEGEWVVVCVGSVGGMCGGVWVVWGVCV